MSTIQKTGGGLVVVRTWSDEERRALAQNLLHGHTIEESALMLGSQGFGYIPGPEAVREVVRHSGVHAFLQRYASGLTREKVVHMHRLYHAHRSDGVRGKSRKGMRLRRGLQRLSVQSIHDAELERRYERLLKSLADASVPNTVPFVFVIRGATCSEFDSIEHGAGEPIPTISLRFELPKRLKRKELNRERKLYMLLLARFTHELVSIRKPSSELGEALRSARVRRLKLYVTEVRNQLHAEHVLVAESPTLPEVRALSR